MSSSKKVLVKNLLSAGWSKGSLLLFRLVQIPFFLHFLGVHEMGCWTILSSLPAWLSLANFGFGSVAANDITLAVAANQWDRAKQVYSTSICLTAIIFVVGIVGMLCVMPFLPWYQFLKVNPDRQSELAVAAIWLGSTVLLSFFAETIGSRYRSARATHVSSLIASFRPWVELAAMWLVFLFTRRLDYLAASAFVATLCYIMAIQWNSLKYQPELVSRISDVRPTEFHRLFRKGVAFQAFPLGNALLFQGNLLVIQSILGTTAVVIFSTARTLIRSVNQLMELVNQAIWPELSHFLGKKDFVRAARLHRLATVGSMLAAFACVLVLAIFGNFIYSLWTGNVLQLSNETLLLFLLPLPFTTLWYTSSVVHAASNQHEGLAVRFIIATSLAVIGCAALTRFFGIPGAAISTVIADLILIPYVIHKSLAITQDTWSGFYSGIRQEIFSIFVKFRSRIVRG